MRCLIGNTIVEEITKNNVYKTLVSGILHIKILLDNDEILLTLGTELLNGGKHRFSMSTEGLSTSPTLNYFSINNTKILTPSIIPKIVFDLSCNIFISKTGTQKITSTEQLLELIERKGLTIQIYDNIILCCYEKDPKVMYYLLDDVINIKFYKQIKRIDR